MKKLIYLFFVCALFAPISGSSQKAPSSFEIRGGEFMFDGKPTRIVSGEMHYSRIPHQYWEHRMKMVKAMGCNAVATYVFWNFHEPQPGVWDFTGDRDLAEYIRTAQREGLYVILRPGPYVCGEWEFGGYPWWLQNIPGIELRRDNEPFLERTKIFIDRIYREVGDLQITNGGPIIMVQAENEFGSYVAQRPDIPMEEHRSFNAKIVAQLKEAGFNVPMFTSDGTWLFEGGSIPGVLPTGNGENNVENLKERVNEYHGGKGPYMVAEFYPGWLMHWAEPFPDISATSIARKTEEYLQKDVSFNYFMIHGGTNFGFWAGANYDDQHDIQPDLTSYDYDAPITEAGWASPKYDSLRNVIVRYVDWEVPAVPEPLPVIEIPSIRLERAADLMSIVTKTVTPRKAEQPMTFEQLEQGYGYVLYRRHFNQPTQGTLEVPGLRDYGSVFVGVNRAGELNRYFNEYDIDVNIPFNAHLQILVENMGRINYGSEIVRNTKGIISPVTIDSKPVDGGWEMYPVPMDKCPDFDSYPKRDVYKIADAAKLAGKPVVYEGTFDLSKTGDTFLDMEQWGKGIVFINGINIGRYWNVGPQQTLYVPGVWLKEGKNSIVIFEQLNEEVKTEIRGVAVPELRKLNL